MAHHVEPMDIDSDFDNKENSLHHNNVLPFTEKGYEELDVSELNMKLRYSITPASSPMSKSYTANCVDNRSLELGDDSLNITINENSTLSRSLNSNMTRNDNVAKSLKTLPLQAISTEQFVDNNRSTSVLRPLDTTISQDDANVIVTVSGPSDIDENLSLLSSSSSTVQTPEATTPTKDNLKNDGGGSPIMRGLKSVLNMFRSSQSPIPPADSEDIVKPNILSPAEAHVTTEEVNPQAMLASTPISAHRKKETSPTKRNSPNKGTIVFNEDLEKELQWKDETTIIFSQERIPIHKLFFQQPQTELKVSHQDVEKPTQDIQDDMNSTVEYMDISYNDSIKDRTLTDIQVIGSKNDCTITGESDGEFVDCESTFTKNDSQLEDKDKTPVIDKTQDLDFTKDVESINENTSASRLKQIILNTTQDILDATLSITPEDLIPEALLKTQYQLGQVPQSENAEAIVLSGMELKANETTDTIVFDKIQKKSLTSQEKLPVINQAGDVMCPSVDVHLEGVSNVTKAFENTIQPILDQTVEITKSPTNTEYNEDITKTMENILVDTINSENQHILGYHDSTSSSETIVHNDDIFEDQLRSQFTNNNNSNLVKGPTQDIELSKTGLNNTSNVNEHNSSNLAENLVTAISSHETLEEILNKSLPHPDDEVEFSTIKEASMTELAAEVPLPDEDDLEKELNVPANITAATTTLPYSLPLDLVDDIKVKSEITGIIHNVVLEEAKLILEDKENISDKIVLTRALPFNTLNFEGVDNIQNETVLLNSEVINAVPEVIENIDIKNEKLPVTEEAQIVIGDVLPENMADQVHDDVEETNRIKTVTDCLNPIVISNTKGNIRQSQEVIPIDINESIIGLKPLPDIVNQTNSMPHVENYESATNTPEPVILEQHAILPDTLKNVTNDVNNPENGPKATNSFIPELITDAHVFEIVKPPKELTNYVREKLPIIPVSEAINKSVVTDGTETYAIEAIPATDIVTDAQLNDVDIIPTEPAVPESNKQPLNTDDVLVNKDADIKTEDDEIILSENNSPFVSVIAEDIPEIKPEENVVLQNIDNRLATTGKVVLTPPASPPIASKGYNFNFDEIDDPFATKTKIRLSPSLDTPTKAVEPKASSRSVEKLMLKKEIINRRKSQPERKKPVAPKRKFNSTYTGADSDKIAEKPVEAYAVGDLNLQPPRNVTLDASNVRIEEDKLIQEARIVHEKTLNVTKELLKLGDDIKPKGEIDQLTITSFTEVFETDKSATIHSKDLKITSSSDQSAYYSAGTSSSESFSSKNVFNIPEIDDKNLNPFLTKSKMRNSPDSSMIFPQNDEIVKAQDVTRTAFPDDKMGTELMEKDDSGNLSNTTTSSKATDERNGTTKEVNTEDEDTIEGPFLEAEDLNTDDKMAHFDGENTEMMQFNDLPAQGNEDNLDNGELFIDAEAFEFLLNQNKSNSVVDSGKESLFLKFDPLFAKRMSSITSDSLVASLNKIQKRQSTPTKAGMPEKEVKSPIAGLSNLNITQDMDISHNLSEEFNEDLNITVSKPMMVVPPAVNPVTPRNKSLTPNRSNRRSITFTSPAMAVIDRLLSLSSNSSLMHDTTVTQATREQNEADLALIQLRELLAEKEIHVYSLRCESKELKDRLTSLESHLKGLEEESQDRLKKINDLNDRLAEKTKINKSMAAVVEEYERTIASLISETAQDKKRHAEERIKLINERDEQTAHLTSMEVSFSDLHSKYEKSKQVILNCKANEDTYKKSIKEFEENLTKMQNNYELLKQHATSKLNHANQELEKMNRTHEAEVLKLNAMIKRKELHITSLEESLAQKTKANAELTAICDELINKVG